MSVIFFDGFARELDPHYWTKFGTVNEAPQSSYLTIDGNYHPTSRLKLKNIGTHSNKKLYFGIRLQACSTDVYQNPFVIFYNTDGAPVLRLNFTKANVSYPDVGISVEKLNDAGFDPHKEFSVNLTGGGEFGQYYDTTTITAAWGNLPTSVTDPGGDRKIVLGDMAAVIAAYKATALVGENPTTPLFFFESYAESDGVGSITGTYLDTDGTTAPATLTTSDVVTWVFKSDTEIVTTYTLLNSIASVAYANHSDHTIFFNGARVIEVELDLVVGAIAVRYEGQNLLNQQNAAVTSVGSINNVSALAVFGGTKDTYGLTTIYDMYLVDNTGTFANRWLDKNFTIHSPNLNGGSLVDDQWDSQAGTYIDGTYLNSNNGDSTYIKTGSFDQYAVFNLDNISPTELIPNVGGVRVSSVSRKTAFDSAYKYTCRIDGANYDFGTKMTLTGETTNYVQQPAQFLLENPSTAAQWTVTQLNATGFGVKSVDPLA